MSNCKEDANSMLFNNLIVNQVYVLTGGLNLEQLKEVMSHIIDAAYQLGYDDCLQEDFRESFDAVSK